jgi:hypothetical protein
MNEDTWGKNGLRNFFCRTCIKIITKKMVFRLCTVIFFFAKGLYCYHSVCTRNLKSSQPVVDLLSLCNVRGVVMEHGWDLGSFGVRFTNFYGFILIIS